MSVQDRFLAPKRMEDEVRAAAGLPAEASRAVVVSSIVRSIAAGVASVVDELRTVGPVAELAIVGGGAASPLVRRALEEAAGIRVIPGAVEAAALGNAILQGVALSRFAGLDDARTWAASEPAPIA